MLDTERCRKLKVSPLELERYLDKKTRLVNRALQKYLPRETTRPSTLHRAMRYSLFAGGKRLRPVLVLASAEACGGSDSAALPAACAVECIHTYSLIHDDLPCMDDDDLRRGMPTCHKVFGEAVAVLAGDALLTLAFEILASLPSDAAYAPSEFVAELARAAGSRALIAGQVADMEAEGGKNASLEDLRFIHRGKTAALLAASLRLGAMSAGADPETVGVLAKFGQRLGMAFQVVDDILDCTQSSEILGKSPGKDAAAGKATYPALLGLEGAQKESARMTREAIRSLDPLDAGGKRLEEIAQYLLFRTK